VVVGSGLGAAEKKNDPTVAIAAGKTVTDPVLKNGVLY